jgi:hypothetical protein
MAITVDPAMAIAGMPIIGGMPIIAGMAIIPGVAIAGSADAGP